MFCGAVLARGRHLLDIYRVAFIGHRHVERFACVEKQLQAVAESLIGSREYVEFYMGRNGEFDIMAASAVRRAQRRLGAHNSCLILVLPYAVADMEDYLNFYQEVIIPFGGKVYPKAAISKRNEWLVENCDLLVAYVTRGTGGAAAALKKAVRSGKSFCLLDRGDLPE